MQSEILVTRKELAKFTGTSLKTVDNRLNELETCKAVQRRYMHPVYRSSGCVRVNLLCYMDFIGNKVRIANNLQLPPFDPKKLADELNIAGE